MTSETVFLGVRVATTDGKAITHSYPMPTELEACREEIKRIVERVWSATNGDKGNINFNYPSVVYNRQYIVKVEVETLGHELTEQVAEELRKRPLGFPTG